MAVYGRPADKLRTGGDHLYRSSVDLFVSSHLMWTLRAAFEVDAVHNVAVLIARVRQSAGAAVQVWQIR
ncbi:MAG: hypothetical protein ACRDRU_25045 [Pseudonocardiaceae bacterium]